MERNAIQTSDFSSIFPCLRVNLRTRPSAVPATILFPFRVMEAETTTSCWLSAFGSTGRRSTSSPPSSWPCTGPDGSSASLSSKSSPASSDCAFFTSQKSRAVVTQGASGRAGGRVRRHLGTIPVLTIHDQETPIAGYHGDKLGFADIDGGNGTAPNRALEDDMGFGFLLNDVSNLKLGSPRG